MLFIAEKTGASKLTLVLAGVAVSGMFSAGTDAVVTFVPDALAGYSDFRIGGLANLSMSRIIPAFWVIAAAMVLIFSLAGELDVLMLGADTAQSLGVRAKPLRLVLLILAAALAGAAVSFSGLIGFVGLIVPHIMRRLIGEDSLPLLAGCALGGAVCLTLCDLLGRLLFAPYELPVGIVLSWRAGPSSSGCSFGRGEGASMIELKNLSAGYGGRDVVHGVSLAFTPGRVLALLGPNGCGKSTLLRTVLGLNPKSGGEVLMDGAPLEALSPRERALKAAYLSQSRSTPNITAYKMVLHGRFPHLSYPRRYRKEDYEAVERALDWADAADVARRSMGELSGGQRQKVYLAMALAQEAPTLLMDEPTTFLDVGHQLEVMAAARRLAKEGRAVVMVLHDLPLALRGADDAALLSEGRLAAYGTAEEVYRSGALDQVFGVALRRVETESGWQYYYG